MLVARSTGPAMIGYLETIGIKTLRELAAADAHALALRINVSMHKNHINKQGVKALQNLIDLARQVECRL